MCAALYWGGSSLPPISLSKERALGDKMDQVHTSCHQHPLHLRCHLWLVAVCSSGPTHSPIRPWRTIPLHLRSSVKG